MPAEEGDEPYPHIGMTSDSLNVALLSAGTLKHPALMFTDPEMAGRVARLVAAGFELARRLARASSTRAGMRSSSRPKARSSC